MLWPMNTPVHIQDDKKFKWPTYLRVLGYKYYIGFAGRCIRWLQAQVVKMFGGLLFKCMGTVIYESPNTPSSVNLRESYLSESLGLRMYLSGTQT